MGIEKLLSIYNPLAKEILPATPAADRAADEALPPSPEVLEPSCRPAMNHWKDSGAVIRLSEYLKRCAPHGISCYFSADRRITLNFTPGLTKADTLQETERGQIAVNALELLCEAADDIHRLIKAGLIDLPRSPRPAVKQETVGDGHVPDDAPPTDRPVASLQLSLMGEDELVPQSRGEETIFSGGQAIPAQDTALPAGMITGLSPVEPAMGQAAM